MHVEASAGWSERRQVEASARWREAFPGAHVGAVLLTGLAGAGAEPSPPALDAALAEIEADLRRTFGSADRATLAALPSVAAYQRYYRPFGQTYHVLRQLESVALKGRPMRSPGGSLVSAMFGAELRSQLLTAGHDVAQLAGDLLVDCARADDRYTGLDGQERTPRAGDMLMRDQHGIISAVLDGPDQRTRLRPQTDSALFVTYAPAGIAAETVAAHLDELARLTRLAAPRARETGRWLLGT